MAGYSSRAIRFAGLMALLSASFSGAQEFYSNSHISPNSEGRHASLPIPTIIKSDPIETESLSQTVETQSHRIEKRETENAPSHHIVTRSAAPKIKKTQDDLLNIKNLPDTIVDNDIELSGRGINMIQPTKTLKEGRVKKMQSTEDTNVSGEAKGAPKGRSLSEPQIQLQPTSVETARNFATLAPEIHRGRQASPDIQDIITGIVKLLNGKVNVQANTAPAHGRPLRPISTRINNRGPPRITDVPALPPDFDTGPLPPPPIGQMPPPPSSTRMPTPYPFDLPPQNSSPVKPYINGVPLPEQLVPNNYPGIRRPVNIPPWKRPQRRPPPRRPLPYNPYKPFPPPYPLESIPMPEETATFSNNSQDILTLNFGSEVQLIPITDEPEVQTETDTSEVVTDVTEILPSEGPPEKEYKDKEKDIPQIEKKKDKNSQKMDKHQSKYNIIVNTSSEINEKSTTTSSTTSATVEPTINATKQENLTKSESSTTMEGVGEATPILDSSILEVMSTTSESSTILSSTPTESLPTSTSTTTIISSVSSTSASSTMKKTSSTTSSKTTDKEEATGFSYFPYRPRPGIVLDDTEYKPGGHRSPIITARPPIGQIGEIFDVTVSAIQGPTGGASGPTKSFVYPDTDHNHGADSKDVITAPSGTEGFVSIDGKRTYLNLFGDDSPTATISATKIIPTPTKPPTNSITATGYAVPHTTEPTRTKPTHRRPTYNRRPSQPPVRIDTCIVGDDSTCDQSQNEICKTEAGVSSCHCKPGYARRKHREPCRRVVAVLMSLRVDRLYDRRVVWAPDLANINSESYQQLAFETSRAVDSAMSMTPFSDEFMSAKVNSVYKGERSAGQAGVFVNLTLQLEENADTSRPTVRNDIQKHLLGVIQRRSNNVGNSALWVDSPPGSVSNLQDLDECSSNELHDCHALAKCINVFGGFQCECEEGYRDPWADNRHRAGRQCDQCPSQFCSNRGECKYSQGQQICVCSGNYYGSQCEVDGEVLGVAVGASVAAVVIIVMTLICLVMWSRRWSREQKQTVGSPVFGYMATAGSTVKTPAVGGPPYQVSLEDRLRWAQIADVMAQANHYAPEPGTVPTRPSSAVFGYPNMSMAGTLQHGTMHGTLPPIPMPRLGLHSHLANRAASVHGMRPLDNSSSSEEEDRADLLGRNFHVPRPKSRSNASVASGIYYDVDYDQNDIYKHHQGGVGIPMSTYTPGRPPFFRN